MKGKSLSKNYIYNFVSQILTLLVPLVTQPYLARVLHENGNGQIAFINSIVTYFISFAAFGFSIYGQREIARNQDCEANQYKKLIEIMTLKLFFSTTSLIVYFIIVFTFFSNSEYKIYLIISTIQIIASFFDVQFFYQGIEDFKSIAQRTIVMRIVGIILIFLLVKHEQDVGVYLFCYSISMLAANCIMWTKIIRGIWRTGLKNIHLRQHLKPSCLIFLPVISGTILSVLDSTMIGYLAKNSEYENGCYGTALKLVTTIILLVTVDTQVLSSRNTHDLSIGNESAVRRHLILGFQYVWMLGLPLMVGLFLMSNHLSLWFLGEGYEKVPLLLKVCTLRILNQGILNVIGHQYFIPSNREGVCTIINYIGIFVNVILNTLLIPNYGCVGAAIASVIAESMMTLIYIIMFIREGRFNDKTMLTVMHNYIVGSIAMGIPVYFLERIVKFSFMNFLLVSCIGALIYVICLIIMKDALIHEIILKIFKKNSDHTFGH